MYASMLWALLLASCTHSSSTSGEGAGVIRSGVWPADSVIVEFVGSVDQVAVAGPASELLESCTPSYAFRYTGLAVFHLPTTDSSESFSFSCTLGSGAVLSGHVPVDSEELTCAPLDQGASYMQDRCYLKAPWFVELSNVPNVDVYLTYEVGLPRDDEQRAQRTP